MANCAHITLSLGESTTVSGRWAYLPRQTTPLVRERSGIHSSPPASLPESIDFGGQCSPLPSAPALRPSWNA